ncbi:MAG: glycosyltransferase, partial [Alphaproteobacteria bacterium]|nr:glycosyltransferase [Alphaproteobacteria bacterium]
MAAAAGNETGFWEHQGVVDIHTALLNGLSMSWDDPRGLPRGYLDSDAAREARAALIERLREDFNGQSLWGVKDPRMCRFLPLWREVFNALGATPRYVLMLRHPLEVVRSLHQRDQMTESRALLLWLRHSLEAEANSRDAARVFLRYGDLIQDWRPVAARVSNALDIPLELTNRKAAAAIKTFIRPSMRHFSLDVGTLAEDPHLMYWAGEVHQALDDAVDGNEGRLAAIMDRVSDELEQAGYYFDDTLAEAAPREARLAEEIHELHTRLNEREKWVAERDRNLKDRENTIQGLLAQGDAIKSLQKQVQGLHRHVSEKDNQVLELQGEISRLHQNFRHIGGTWSWRLTRPMRGLARIGTGILGSLNILTHEMVPMSFHQMRRTAPGHYRAETTTSHMVLSSRRGRQPRGWVRIDYEIRAKRRASPFLFFDDGKGFREAARLRLPPTRAGIGSVVVRLPDTVTGLRLDPVSFIGEFELGDVRITELNGLMLTATLVKTRVLATQSDDRGLLGLLDSLRSAFLRGGISELKHGLRHQATEPLRSYDNWRETYADLSEGDAEAIGRHIEALQHKPLLSIIMPTYNTPSEILRSAVGSITSQLYPNWELCIADDASTSVETLAVLREYAGTDERIKITYRSVNGHISEASNSALEMARGEFVILVDHDDELTPHALYMVATEINRYPDTDIIYSDEDKIDKDGKIDHPYFKSDFSPDMFLAQNFINHLSAYRRGVVEEVGRFRKGFEGSQDYDLALRVIEKSTPERIRHIPHVLYHWRSIEGSVASGEQEKSYAIEAARKAIREHLKRRGVKATVTAGIGDFGHRVVYALPNPPPKVSLIVPTRDRIELLKMVVDGAQNNNDYPNWDMTIVDNGSEKEETATYLAKITKDTRIKVLRDDGPFNFSRLNNRAVAVTDGEIIGLINNDIE